MRRLEGKTILVAGSGGIGGGLARRYALEGARVVLGDIDVDGAKAVVDDIKRAGGTATATRLDGADEASVTAAVALARQSYGGIDGLHINFASFADGGSDAGVLEVPLETFDQSLRVNVRGYLLCTRAALPAILARGGGAIIYTSSAAAYLGEKTRVAYAMGKAASHALMRHVAAKYGPQGVRANCIAPGIIMHERFTAEAEMEIKDWAFEAAHIKSRLGRPDDIASMSALLMSDEGSFITGQIIGVDGGTTMRP
jgi:NAD(P)-dependent dehydrogenase (short-subunit alcohol dehydrogenase family)